MLVLGLHKERGFGVWDNPPRPRRPPTLDKFRQSG